MLCLETNVMHGKMHMLEFLFTVHHSFIFVKLNCHVTFSGNSATQSGATIYSDNSFVIFTGNCNAVTMYLHISRDWSEIVWLPKISRFKINLAIGFIQKNPLECIG